jgi:tRNA pseudouridine55 synthase
MQTEPSKENKFDLGQVMLVNKPIDWTSFDVVRKLRNLVRTKKVGHAGTLDPLASGLLIVCTGKFTKQINTYMAAEKEYTGTFILGAVTPTYDLESEPTDFKEIAHLKDADIQAATQPFIGSILQYPPMHSAIKVNGKRLYELARKGKELELEARPIQIHQFDILQIEGPVVHFRVVCSTGTYIRSLAHDFGQALGCGAYLGSLCRTRIGPFLLEDALTMTEWESHILHYREEIGG